MDGSRTTRKLETQFSQARLRESLDPHGHPFSGQPHIPVLLEAARQQLSAAGSPEQKAQIAGRVRQLDMGFESYPGSQNPKPQMGFEHYLSRVDDTTHTRSRHSLLSLDTPGRQCQARVIQ